MAARIVLLTVLILLSAFQGFAQTSDQAHGPTISDEEAAGIVRNVRSNFLLEISKLAGLDLGIFDQDSAVLKIERDGLIATLSSQDGRLGAVVTFRGSKTPQEGRARGVYVFEKRDGVVYAQLNGQTIEPAVAPRPPEHFLYPLEAGDQCPGFGCGCWADLELADQCFWTTVCAQSGWCP
jgi:hypothetical protein